MNPSILLKQLFIPIFGNITRSEMRHTTAIAELLEKYNIEDPAAEHKAGIFHNQQLQTLYNQLVEQGMVSYEEAIRVGLQIEELDIADIEKAMKEEVDQEDIEFVYNNLLEGSKRHLNAFWFHASKNSIEYKPEHISQVQFNEITGTENP